MVNKNKVITGTKGIKVVRGQTDPRQLRCKCGELATARPNGKGGTVTTCTSCRRTFSSTPI